MHEWYWSCQYPDFLDSTGELIEFDSYLVPESDLEEMILMMEGTSDGSSHDNYTFNHYVNNYFRAYSSELEIVRRKIQDQMQFNSPRCSNPGDIYNCNSIYNDKGTYPDDLILTERQRAVLHVWLKSLDAGYHLRYSEEKGFQMFSRPSYSNPIKPSRLLIGHISLGCADNNYNNNFKND